MERLEGGRSDRGEDADPADLPGGWASEASGAKKRQTASMLRHLSIWPLMVSAFRPTALPGL